MYTLYDLVVLSHYWYSLMCRCEALFSSSAIKYSQNGHPREAEKCLQLELAAYGNV